MKFADKFCKKRPPLRQARKLKSVCAVQQILVVIWADDGSNNAAGIDIPEINRDKQ